MSTLPQHPFRYSRLGYVHLQVTNLEDSARFYNEHMGLQRGEGTEGEVWLRCSNRPYDLILSQGPVPGLHAVGFEIENDAEFDKALRHVEELSFAPVMRSAEEVAGRMVQRAFTFRNPDTGLNIEFYVGQKEAAEPFERTVAKIARLGHVVLNCRSMPDALHFWVDQLGFAVSDQVPGRAAFLRAWPNPLHHSFALIHGERDGFNHINFMVSDIDDIGSAMNRMKKANVPIVFGPGRHLPSESIFIYFLDPDGMTAEFSFGMEEIPEDSARLPRDLEASPETLDTWGSLPDPRFGKVGDFVAAHA